MLRTIWIASMHTRTFMRRYMPTNILIDAIRTRRGLKWGIPAMLLAIPYLYVAATCRTRLEHGGPGWLHLIVLVCIWNALKMLWLGPVSVLLLTRVRGLERAARRALDSEASDAGAAGAAQTNDGALRTAR